jgi:hypothetical protein
VPSAILRPKFSATMLVGHAITRLMWCSTSSTVMPMRSRMSRISRPAGRQFLVVQAGRGLVEQQQLGLGGQRAAELDPLLDAERQITGRTLAILGEVQVGA